MLKLANVFIIRWKVFWSLYKWAIGIRIKGKIYRRIGQEVSFLISCYILLEIAPSKNPNVVSAYGPKKARKEKLPNKGEMQ